LNRFAPADPRGVSTLPLMAAALLALAAGSMQARAAAGSAPSTRVFRCEANGQTTYSQSPCPAGSAVDVADPRSADERAQAKAAAERERRLARELAAERQQAERAAARQAPGNLGPARPAASAASSASQARKGHHHGTKSHAASGAEGTGLSPPVRVPPAPR
jgi:hypothetical protein